MTESLLCRETALLEFNRRVLAQAEDERVPLLERLRFVCIVSSNLDEFFEVRVALLKRLIKTAPYQPLQTGELPHEVLNRVRHQARTLINEQYALFQKLLPLLRDEGIVFYKRNEWSDAQRKWIEDYFHREIKPVLTPVGLDPSHPFPKTLNKSLNFAVELSGKDAFGRASDMAILQAPRILPRLVRLPDELCDGHQGLVFLSSIMHEHIQTMFLGMEVKGFHQFRLTRDSELTVGEDDLKNLRTAIQGELHERQYGSGVRLEVATKCPAHVTDFLLEQFQLTEADLYRVDGPVNLVRLMSVPEMVDRPDLCFPNDTPSTPKSLRQPENLLDTIRAGDVLLYHPYQSFQPVVDFIRRAAVDPDVVAIKMTIYRTGKKSDLIRALIAAALAGKEVTVVVELMARFDEEANVTWASQLEDAGALVVYGVFGYKVHAKMALIVRRENGILKRYAHLGTGNYHQGTSRIYTDFGLLTANDEITSDVNDLFIQITGLGQAGELKKLYQSPFSLHSMVMHSIEQEIQAAQEGKPAKIIAKMNSLLEPQVIQALYRASQAGVQVDLIVRGMCALRPQVTGLSENIRVRSIIGKQLEHARVYYFYHHGAEDVYIASADWMARNFFSRIETCIPIQTPALKQRIIDEGLSLALQDNCQAWEMLSDGSYQRVSCHANEPMINMQESLWDKYRVNAKKSYRKKS